VFDRIHCSFDRFIGKISRYSLVEDFTVHILNQMDSSWFLLNFIDFGQFFLKKPMGSDGSGFLVSASFLNLPRGCDAGRARGRRL
jgi:hypothetical protein